MPLPAAHARRMIHERNIQCRGYIREDGIWDIEGTFTDIKTETFYEGDKAVPAGAHYHCLSLRISCDDNATIVEAVADISNAPFQDCQKTAIRANGLVGMTIKRGFLAEARRVIGGVCGCTHLVELLGEVAGTAFQTMHAARKRNSPKDENTQKRPILLNTCFALRADGPTAHKKWPEFAVSPPTGSDQNQS